MDCGGTTPLWLHGENDSAAWRIERRSQSGVVPPQSRARPNGCNSGEPRSTVVWRGNTVADGSGKPLRLFKTTFDNPDAMPEIRSLELLTLFARAN